MNFVREFHLKLNRLIESFEHAQKSDSLRIGGQDKKVRKFIISVLDLMIERYGEDEIYFGLAELLGELIYRLGDYDTGYRVWIDFDIDRITEISLGNRENLNKLQELRDYYKN